MVSKMVRRIVLSVVAVLMFLAVFLFAAFPGEGNIAEYEPMPAGLEEILNMLPVGYRYCFSGEAYTIEQPVFVGSIRLCTTKPERMIGYGPTSSWPGLDPAAFGDILVQNRVMFTEIRLFPKSGLIPEIAAAKRFITEMRKHNIHVLVEVVNANDPLHPFLDDIWFEGVITAFRDAVGMTGIVLAAVTEPQAVKLIPEVFAKMQRWQDRAAMLWRGQLASYAYPLEPTTYISVAGYAERTLRDYHYCDMPSALQGIRTFPTGSVHNTDCWPLVASVLKLEEAAALARAAWACKTFLMIYDHNLPSPNYEMIRAMGAAISTAPQSC